MDSKYQSSSTIKGFDGKEASSAKVQEVEDNDADIAANDKDDQDDKKRKKERKRRDRSKERDDDNNRRSRKHRSRSKRRRRDYRSRSRSRDRRSGRHHSRSSHHNTRRRRSRSRDNSRYKKKEAYVPPQRRAVKDNEHERRMSEARRAEIEQRDNWDKLRKSINGIVNRLNVSNIAILVQEIFKCNLVRGRGLLCKSLMAAQTASHMFTPVYAALIAVINTKLPANGELLLKRLVHQFNKSWEMMNNANSLNIKADLVASVKFIAHLVNQRVAHELIALEILHFLLENPTDDSIEIAVEFTMSIGAYLAQVSPQGLIGVFDQFRTVLQEGMIDKKVQYSIEKLFDVRRDEFKDFPSVVPELDLVEASDQNTHLIELDSEVDIESHLDAFQFSEAFIEEEEQWRQIQYEILGEEAFDDNGNSNNNEVDEGIGEDHHKQQSEDEDGEEHQQLQEETEGQEGQEQNQKVRDETGHELVALRRVIYLTIMSSLSFEECAHKLTKLRVPEGMEMEMITTLIECCSQERTYLKYHGLVGARLSLASPKYRKCLHDSFALQYNTIQRLETNKIRNVANFYAHLLQTDALTWDIFECIILTEQDTTSSNRVFTKILLQELYKDMGERALKAKFEDPAVGTEEGVGPFRFMFPYTGTPENLTFAINFFTAIGLGSLTEKMRVRLQQMLSSS